jgi:photosystem II stability/assembly factor-like uncharacterized protein
MPTQLRPHLSRIALFLSFLLIALIAVAAYSISPTMSPPLQQWRFFTADTGWVRQANDLYWTTDGGQSWQKRTPPIPIGTYWHTLYFHSPAVGWGLFSELGPDGRPQFSLAQTTDGGQSWAWHTLDLFPAGDVDAYLADAQFHFLDAHTGWLLTKRASSSNFDVGTLFFTSDGGYSWERRAAPITGDLLFVTAEQGWLAGGPDRRDLYTTSDGGRSWTAQRISDNGGYYQRPFFTTPTNGLLPVLHATHLSLYQTANGGEAWAKTAVIPLTTDPGASIPLEITNATHWYLNATQIDGRTPLDPRAFPITPPTDTLFTAIQMVSASAGWAVGSSQTCHTASCLPQHTLYRTQDNGQTWTAVALPAPPIPTPDLPTSNNIHAVTDNIGIMQGQGFDKCEIATLSQLQTWMNSSPYDAVNLYIGGVSRACANTALTASYLNQLSQQGWKFIPTWVGLQASCSGYANRMSSDPTTAYNQGRNEASSAAAVAANLGLTASGQSGTIIYYDLEAYDTSNTTCRNAAKAFINGWTERLEELGNEAGVYGSACASAISDFATISNVPDQIWPAHWIYSSYNANASVWDVLCISNGMWVNSQRIRQYTGGHNETWGNVTLNIDSNVLDGKVADISNTPPVLQNPSFETGSREPWTFFQYNNACNWAIYTNSSIAHDGSKYLATNENGNNPDCSGFYQDMTTSPQVGQTYRFAIWVRSVSSSAPRSGEIAIWGMGGTQENSSTPFDNVGATWRCVETALTIQHSGHNQLRAELYLQSDDTIDFYFDDARFTVGGGSLCAPQPPTSISASDGTYTDKVRVSWSSAAGATGYRIYRNTANSSSGSTQIGSSTGTTYDDTTATPGITYYYWVRAENGVGVGDYSASDSGYRGLSAPTNVAASDGTYTDKVRITWGSVSGATGYSIYRNTQ